MIQFVATAYNQPIQGFHVTGTNTTILVNHDSNLYSKFRDFAGVGYYNFTNTGFWGAKNRQWWLDNAEYNDDDYVVMTDVSNYHSPELIRLLSESDEDFVMWSIVHHGRGYQVLEPEMKRDHIDWCSFAVKAKFLKETGIVEPEKINSDGITVEALRKIVKTIKVLPQILIIKN